MGKKEDKFDDFVTRGMQYSMIGFLTIIFIFISPLILVGYIANKFYKISS